MPNSQDPHIYRFAENAIVLSSSNNNAPLANQQKIWALAQACRSTGMFSDVVPGMNNLTVYIIDHSQIPYWLEQLAVLWQDIQTNAFSSREITIPVNYGNECGPDLAYVANYHKLNEEQVIKRHSNGQYRVYFLGFQPGFAYLNGLDLHLHTPRRENPRLVVPAGSVGIGGAQTGVYPAAAPGGWQLIGQTQCTLFNPDAQQPTLLLPGDIVRFTAEITPEIQAND